MGKFNLKNEYLAVKLENGTYKCMCYMYVGCTALI